MSSSTGASRTRLLRKPAFGTSESSKRDGPSTRNEPRTLSPSRLPVKPTMTTRSAAANPAGASSTAASRIRASGSTTGRPPLSGTYSKTTSARSDNGGNAAAPRPLGRALSTRQPASSTTSKPPPSRSVSATVSRPRSSGGQAPTATSSSRVSGHTRSKSTVTSLTAATTLRPTSQVSSASSGRTSPTASTITTASTRSKLQTRSQTHTRAKSQAQPTTTTTTATTTTQAPARPAFNNHQQHFSPAKNLAPKPLTSTFLAPPSPSKLPANVAISAETSRLQTELLQLSLLHRDAAAVDAEWHASARQKLNIRFDQLVSEHESLQNLERAGVEDRSIAALAQWGSSSSGQRYPSLEEKIQILDEALNGVWVLGEAGGRYARVVAGFETWAGRMASIVSAQRSNNLDVLVDAAGDEVRFLADLDAGWKHECASLQRKLAGWRDALRALGDVPSGTEETSTDADTDTNPNPNPNSASGLERMVDGARALVRDMLAELALMQHIERDAARAEDRWIETMNKAIEDEDDDTPAARAYVPLWKLAG
ncbi:hypothetical protein M426DRAFT_317015 [Hypoxylon sp. CI-4A]|nr:hypothetical protein M426DRAFT_317015 [Hypoxylon sp. CI-4A]